MIYYIKKIFQMLRPYKFPLRQKVSRCGVILEITGRYRTIGRNIGKYYYLGDKQTTSYSEDLINFYITHSK